MDYFNNLDTKTYIFEPLCQFYYQIRAHPFKAIITAFLAGRIYLIIYRLYFHPLARLGVPGPFLAKVTSLYEYYYDFLAIPNGQLQFHVTNNLHPTYGPIIRTHPDKVRINDLTAYRTIHAVGSKFTKDPLFYQHFGIAQSSAFMVDVGEHKKRRAVMAPLFARKEIVRLEGMMREKVGKLRERLEREIPVKGERTWELHCEMQAVTGDVVMEFAYGESDDLLTNKPFNESHIMLSLADNAIEKTPIGKYSPVLKWITSSLIARIFDVLFPSSGISDTYKAQQRVFTRVKSLRRQHLAGTLTHSPGDPITLFSELLTSFPSDRALAEEALLVYFAGMDTTSFALSRAFYFLAAHPSIQERVYRDVHAVWPDRSLPIPTYTQFEKQEYFGAFMKEVYRLSYGVSGTLPRVVPPGGAQLGRFYFPGGTRVETCNYSISHHPELWGGEESSRVFEPERWLREGSKEDEKWVVNFGVGSRACMGMYFAIMEMVLVVATVVGGFELRLGEELEREGMRWVDKWLPINRGKWEVLLKRREEKVE